MPALQSANERIYYRDRIRQARYAALADAEGFEQVCFALEELGVHLLGKQKDLGEYSKALLRFLKKNCSSIDRGREEDIVEGLLTVVREARNDAMHTGSYARHVTAKAIELCLVLEDAIMNGNEGPRLVRDHMVAEPVTVKAWQPVARARQLMLTYSFSNLPVWIDKKWMLVTELGLAQYLLNSPNPRSALGSTIKVAATKLNLIQAPIARGDQEIHSLLGTTDAVVPGTVIWVIPGAGNELNGIISAFELM